MCINIYIFLTVPTLLFLQLDYVYLAVNVLHLIYRPSFSFSIVFGSSKLLDRFLADARWRWGYDLCKSQQRVVFCGGLGDLFELHSRASNGNVCSTLLFATAPMQLSDSCRSSRGIHEC
jgi:hypothetical protein